MTGRPGHEAEQVAHALVEAWNRHDASAFASVFARDAEFTNVFGMEAEGRAAIERFHAPIFDTMFRDSSLCAERIRCRLLRDDIATLDIRWSMTGARDPAGNEWPLRRGLMSLVATREHEGWRIASMHNMELADMEMAEAQKAVQAGS